MREGHAPYRHASERLGLSRSGWGWESRLADFDNDGVLEAIQACGFIKGQVNRWPELQALGTSNDQVVHNPRFWPNFKPGADLSGHDWNPFFVRGKDGRFYDVAPALGLAEPRVSKGIATADVDGDGRLDFATANQWEPSFFYHNRSPEVGRFLTLRLLLPTARTRDRALAVRAGHETQDWRARPAIGATVRATLPSGRVLVSQVDGGAGHSGRRSAEVHLGLGAVAEAASVPVEIRWRDTTGQPQRLELELPPGRHSLLLGETGARRLVARIEEPHP
jgi:hypothetical protein